MKNLTYDIHRKLHISWLISWASAGVNGGIALAAVVSPGLGSVQLWLIALSFLAVGLIKRTVWAVSLFILAGLLLGLSRGATTSQQLSGYEAYFGKTVTVRGVVSEDTTLGKQGDQRVKLKNVHVNDDSLPGEVWVSTVADVELKRSDYLEVRGVLNEGFGTTPATMFDADIVAAKRTKHGDIALEARDWFADGVRTAIPEPQASLGIGFLLGQRSSLPEELDTQLRILGLTHIVVASGYNLTILVRFARRGLAKQSKYLALVGSSGLIMGFVLMTGFSPSMSRAALVAGLSLLAWYFGRSIQAMVILPFSAAITAFIHPAYVWGDLGWYLSFLSFAGIMLLAQLIQHYFWGKDAQLGTVRRIVIETMSAQLATLPLIAWVFGQYSILSLPANVLILPFVPLAMALSFAAGIGALALPAAATILGAPAYLVLSYMTTVTDKLAAIPWAAADVQVGAGLMIAGYVTLVTIGMYLWRVTNHRFGNDNVVV